MIAAIAKTTYVSYSPDFPLRSLALSPILAVAKNSLTSLC
ncbi:unnamed protein product [Acidithrix sp. C25]|nr:unnamed protein product [Acidithrix sp. C25]